MERINENTIRVLIGNDDLSARGITVLDLLGNHQQIESFFYSILEEVDTEHQFQDNDSVTLAKMELMMMNKVVKMRMLFIKMIFRNF